MTFYVESTEANFSCAVPFETYYKAVVEALRRQMSGAFRVRVYNVTAPGKSQLVWSTDARDAVTEPNICRRCDAVVAEDGDTCEKCEDGHVEPIDAWSGGFAPNH